MGLIQGAIRNRHAMAVVALGTIAIGVVAASRIPIDILPAFRAPAVQSMTFYSGMPAGVVEKNITNRLERWTGQASGTQLQESKSMVGVSVIRNYFSDGTDPNTALTQVNSLAMSNLRYLPPGTLPPIVMPFDPTATLPTCILSVASEKFGEGELQDIGRYELRSAIQSVNGAVAPAVFGGKSRAIMAYVDRDKVEARGLSPVTIVEAIRDSNLMLPTGGAKIGDIDYQIESNSMYDTPGSMERIPIEARLGNAGYVGDVGKVEDAARIQTGLVRINGRRQVYVPVYRQQGASTLDVVDGVKAALPSMRQRIPDGIDLQVVMDQSVYVRNAIESLVHEGVLGAILAAGMILVFLGSFRSTVIAVVTIPLALLTAIAGLLVTGNSINSMTLGGMALAIGPLVDNAIVVLENTHRHLAMGKSPAKAALDAAQEVALPVLVATLTTIIVLVPIALSPGMGKFLFSPLALTVAVAMIGSYAFAMTLVPCWCAAWLKHDSDHGSEPHAADAASTPKRKGIWSRLHGGVEATLDAIASVYEGLLRRILKGRLAFLGLVLIMLLGSLALVPFLGQELFPQVDAGQIILTMRDSTGTRLETTEKSVIKVEDFIRESIPSGDLGMIISELGVVPDWSAAYTPNTGPQDAVIKIQLTDHRSASAQDYAVKLRAGLGERFPGLQFAFNTGGIVSTALNYGALSPINMQVAGKKLDDVRKVAQMIRASAAAVRGAADVRIQQRFDYPQLYIDVDHDKAAELGLTQQEVIQNVVTCLNSSIQFARNFWIDPVSGNQYWVGVQYREEDINSIDDLLNVPITGKNTGGTVLLRNIATIRRLTAPAEMTHVNYAPVVEILANVSGRDAGSVASDIEAAVAKMTIPDGVRVEMRGEVKQMRASFGAMGASLAMATVLVYLIMVALFRSFVDPLIVLFVVPQGLIGVVVTLYATDTTLNVQSALGIIFMVGIVVANSVLLVDFANRLVSEGVPVREAVAQAGVTRLRPIMMTFLATFLSLLPMAIGAGRGGEANVPLARAVLGGLVAGTVLTLLAVPTLYTLLRRDRPSPPPGEPVVSPEPTPSPAPHTPILEAL